jgi:hypothetical protein
VRRSEAAGAFALNPSFFRDPGCPDALGGMRQQRVVVAGNYGMEENTLIAPRNVPY